MEKARHGEPRGEKVRESEREFAAKVTSASSMMVWPVELGSNFAGRAHCPRVNALHNGSVSSHRGKTAGSRVQMPSARRDGPPKR